MAFIELIEPGKATGKLKRIYEAAVARVKCVAQIIQVMCRDPDSCQASMGLYASLMKKENGLSVARREMLATVVSNVNDCYY